MDCREELLAIINLTLTEAGIDANIIRDIKDKIVLDLSKYDISHKSNEIALIDQNSEKYLLLFLGTLRTEGKSNNTLDNYGRLINRFWRDIQKPLTEVTAFDVRFWIANKQREISARSCENYRSYLSSFYHWMEAEGFIDKNPMAKIKPVAYVDEQRKAFSPVELDRLRSGCETKRQRALLEMLLSTGARASELSEMNKSDIDLNSKTVRIRHGKGGKQRTVYINDVCREHLVAYLHTRHDINASLFVSKQSTRLAVGSIEDELHRIGVLSGVSDVHPHRCRRTFATTLYQKGMDVVTIQTLMGHSNLNTTMGYIAIADNRIKLEYQRLA